MTLLEFILYLIYGFAMISVGIFAIVQTTARASNISLIRSLKYLGAFAIAHGISEWITLIIKLELCHPHMILEVYYANVILKAVSFLFLLRFGLDLFPAREKYKRMLIRIPWLTFLLYLVGFSLFMVYNGPDYHFINRSYNIIVIRYFMAIPSSMITAYALYLNARSLEKTNPAKIAHRYRNLAWVFVGYGVVEGLLVSRADFFPANIIHIGLFPEYFSLITLAFKAVVGFIINYLLIQVIDTFSWQQEARMLNLEKHRIASEERRKLGLEIHDGLIQELYALGLKIEYLASFHDQPAARDTFDQIKASITNTINKTREFISVNASDEIELDKLKDSLEELVRRYNESQGIKIELKWNVPSYLAGNLSPEAKTQIYYIVQEAITNIIKHSRADYASVLFESGPEYLYVTITDNGRGISRRDTNPGHHFGIRSMKERTQRLNGLFNIDVLLKGTSIELKIPWEDNYDLSDQGPDSR